MNSKTLTKSLLQTTAILLPSLFMSSVLEARTIATREATYTYETYTDTITESQIAGDDSQVFAAGVCMNHVFERWATYYLSLVEKEKITGGQVAPIENLKAYQANAKYLLEEAADLFGSKAVSKVKSLTDEASEKGTFPKYASRAGVTFEDSKRKSLETAMKGCMKPKHLKEITTPFADSILFSIGKFDDFNLVTGHDISIGGHGGGTSISLGAVGSTRRGILRVDWIYSRLTSPSL